MEFIYKFWQNFSSYSLEILPYFIGALMVATFLKIYFPSNFLNLVFKSQGWSPLLAGTIGAILPLCSCSVIPLAYYLNNFSRSFAPVLSFLMIAPVISPVTILLTLGVLGHKFALFRLIFAFISSLLVAYLSMLLFKKKTFVQGELSEFTTLRGEKSWRRFLYEFKREGLELSKYILLGILIASILTSVFSPEDLRFFSAHFLSYLLLTIISIPIYVCSGEEVPIAKAMTELGFSCGQAMVFVLAGSGICLPTIFASLKILPFKVVIYYVISWLLLSLIGGIGYDIFVSQK